jgi:transcriptional regulator with GAF, ATPase, and Fis domain
MREQDLTLQITTEALPAHLRVAVIDGPDSGAVAIIGEGSVLVGSDPAAHLVLTDPAVSRQHVILERAGESVVVRDCGSRNGTFLGGQRVNQAVATIGSVLRVGRSTLALLRDGMPQPIDPGPPSLGHMIGSSSVMRRLFGLLGRLAASDATVLVWGETGSGKELVARTLHEQSRRASGPFVVFDCAAVPESLIAGELFGHVRGAFTGAHRDHAGAFERAHGGTLFIDEIGELLPELQPKLLRALETRTVRRIGDRDEQQIDVRIVAATHRDLWQMVAERRFREDLLYRLAVVTVSVPPLRDRRQDIADLIAHFASQLDPPPPALPADVLARLQEHHWPGNLRELRNLVERAAALGSWREGLFVPPAQQPIVMPSSASSLSGIAAEMGPGAVLTAARGGEGAPVAHPMSVPFSPLTRPLAEQPFREAKEQAMSSFERLYLTELLRTHQWNLSRAARAAGMDRSHLSTLVRKHGLRDRGLD